jgi:hypothetical protein
MRRTAGRYGRDGRAAAGSCLVSAALRFPFAFASAVNGRTSGACPGYVKDHIKALKCGGLDAVLNLQWQTTGTDGS